MTQICSLGYCSLSQTHIDTYMFIYIYIEREREREREREGGRLKETLKNARLSLAY